MASGKPTKKNPRLASGRKRTRQGVKLNAANTSLRSKYRTVVKNVEKAVLTGDKAKATELFAKAQSVIDTLATRAACPPRSRPWPPPNLSPSARAARRPPFALGALSAKQKNRLFRRFFCGREAETPLPASRDQIGPKFDS